MARTSAQETRPRHRGTASTAALARRTVSKPSPARPRFTGWSFSAVLLGVDATTTEASQPSTKQSWKKSRTVAPMAVPVCWTFLATTPRTMDSTPGHTPA